ncbi:hypothetical protein AVEN_119860-1, partial [Araneus ventricosus]
MSLSIVFFGPKTDNFECFPFIAASLQIMETEEDDQGSYECVADNEKGTAVSGPATLYVR